MTMTKPVNELEIGDRVTRIADPAHPDYGPEFVVTVTVVGVKQYKGQTIAVRALGGRFWPFELNDRRVAHLEAA